MASLGKEPIGAFRPGIFARPSGHLVYPRIGVSHPSVAAFLLPVPLPPYPSSFPLAGHTVRRGRKTNLCRQKNHEHRLLLVGPIWGKFAHNYFLVLNPRQSVTDGCLKGFSPMAALSGLRHLLTNRGPIHLRVNPFWVAQRWSLDISGLRWIHFSAHTPLNGHGKLVIVITSPSCLRHGV